MKPILLYIFLLVTSCIFGQNPRNPIPLPFLKKEEIINKQTKDENLCLNRIKTKIAPGGNGLFFQTPNISDSLMTTYWQYGKSIGLRLSINLNTPECIINGHIVGFYYGKGERDVFKMKTMNPANCEGNMEFGFDFSNRYLIKYCLETFLKKKILKLKFWKYLPKGGKEKQSRYLSEESASKILTSTNCIFEILKKRNKKALKKS